MLPHAHLTTAGERLIAAHIDSVGALDLLLLLHDGRDREWTAKALCESLRCPDAWAIEQLARLEAAGLVAEVAEGSYRYQRGRRHGAAADSIARACRRDRASVTRLIFAQPPGSQFAR